MARDDRCPARFLSSLAIVVVAVLSFIVVALVMSFAGDLWQRSH